MKGDPVFRKIFYSSWFLAVFPAIIIMLFLHPLGSKSKLQVEPVVKISSVNVYEDLNSDTISEVIRSGKGTPYFNILVLDNDMRVYDQWNFKDSMDVEMFDFFFGNFDHDKYKEIYAFTYKEDSLFLNINEFFDRPGTKLDRIYMTDIRIINKKVTSMIWPAGFYDTNGDGIDELFFSIQTGFGVDPRHLYSYDIVHNKLKTSQLTGMIPQYPKMVDTDGDGRPEIFGVMGASGNSKTWYPYSDWSAWFMVFDDSLKIKFPPVEFPGLTNVLEIEPYTKGELKSYAVSYNTGSADTTVLKPRIMLFSLDGKKIREHLFSDIGLNSFTRMAVMKSKNSDRIYLLGQEFIEVNDKLEVANRIKSPFNTFITNIYFEDVDFNGEKELVLYAVDEEKIVIYNSELRKVAETKLKGSELPFRFSHFSSKDHESKSFVNAGRGYGYFLKLRSNFFYYLGFLMYPGVYILFLLFILLIKRINTLQVVQKESLNRRLVTLQLQGIKSQLDPHFTFNTLNSIASLIYLEDRELAYDYMNKFTHLLRNLINDAERIYRSLGEELEFVTTYLDLEKLRFGVKFDYRINISESVTLREQVPKLVLHTFAENAIKHGIMSRNEGGMLKIDASKVDGYLILSIEDNGIGRAKAEGLSTSTGRGLKLTREFYDILNQLNSKPIRHSIIDLHDEAGCSTGTKVEVWVPVE
jgi:two-component sensor histidine kinase